MREYLKKLTPTQQWQLESGTLSEPEVRAILNDPRPHTVAQTRDDEVVRTEQRPSSEEAIDLAIEWAEKEGLIREGEAGDDFAASHVSWTREELRYLLRTQRSYDDGEIVTTVSRQNA